MRKPRKVEVEWMRLYHELTPQERQVARGLVLVQQTQKRNPPARRWEFIKPINKPILLGE